MKTEKELLQSFLDSQRRHVLEIIDGLSEQHLQEPVLPSGWTIRGMLKHLSLADEHYWFRAVVGGESFDFFPEEPDGDWTVSAQEDPLALYREEIRRSDEIIAGTELDSPPRQRDPQWDAWGMDFPDLRYIMLHVITETATHAGHLDAVRELLDGRQYIVL